MIINNALRRRLYELLPKNYRQVVVARLNAKGITVHPNTVRNVLEGNANSVVAAELVELASEGAALEKKANRLVKQLSV